MARERSVDLIEPVPFNGQMVAKLVLREPGMKACERYGEPSIHTRSPDGTWVLVDNDEAIYGHLRASLPPEMVGVLDHVGLADTLRLKDEVLGFFGDARAAGAKAAQKSSSANSDGSPPPSSAPAP